MERPFKENFKDYLDPDRILWAKVDDYNGYRVEIGIGESSGVVLASKELGNLVCWLNRYNAWLQSRVADSGGS